MKIPAIRAKIGDWDYYVSTLTFDQVSKFVSRVDDELHKSNSLKDLIQRSITENYISIKKYILNEQELFFNSLVLAVYDEYPDWSEIEFKYDDIETYKMGILNFPGKHKIFPVDGQHRVEGIKAALLESPELGSQTISVIFIGHKNDESGMRRTRRLFSTLNRYAKPVTWDDIIALDEDDAIAIVTRELLEEHVLFTGNKVTKNKNPAILNDDKISFTSIINLYNCNKELLKLFRKKAKREHPDWKSNKTKFNEYLKFRPSKEELDSYNDLCFGFWNAFFEKTTIIESYVNSSEKEPAKPYRNSEVGGNLLFRPVGLYPFVQACIEIHQRTDITHLIIFLKNLTKKTS